MNYEFILKDLKPSENETKGVYEISDKLIKTIDNICKNEDINAKAHLVGSVSKKTWLSGKSDIDIFIRFPLDTSITTLKEKGLYIGHKVNDLMNGEAWEHYASHPYLTCDIEGYEVDFVPCYKIKTGDQIKSAVDRTVLHTEYIQSNLKEEQIGEVLLLKKFMDCIRVYGSEFKTGGFAGYLCELLILKYNTFENTLKEVSKWKYNVKIDLENYGTSKNFKKDPLVFIDPTDKNRNVGAALRLERMVDFILASRNFLKIIKDKKLSEEEKEKKVREYFTPLKKELLNKENIINDFLDRGTKTLILQFEIPEISADSLHPQLKKTIESLSEKIETEEFSVFKSDYWTNEEDTAIFIIELNVYTQSKYKIHKGPKIWPEKACDNFKGKWGEKCYPLDDFLVLTKEREFRTVEEYLRYILTEEHISIIKVGKNIRKTICDSYQLNNIEDILLNLEVNNEYDFLNKLDDFLRPGQYLKR